PLGVLPAPVEAWLRPMRLRRGVLLVSALFGALTGLAASTQWQTIELFRHRETWAVADPIFGRDVAFYVFELPFYRWVLGLLGPALFLALLAAAVIYVISGSLRWQGGSIAADPRSR